MNYLGIQLYIATSENNYDLVKKLLRGGGHPEYAIDPLGSGKSALEVACENDNYKIAADLLGAEAEPLSALHFVATNRNIELMKLLIEYGAKPDQCLRCNSGHGDLVDEMVLSNNLHNVDPEKLLRCVQSPAAAKVLLSNKELNPNRPDQRLGNTALHEACRRGIVIIVKLLLQDSRVCVNVKNRAGQTPLHLLAFSDLYASSDSPVPNVCQIAQHLLDCNADVNAVDSDGATALHTSCQFGIYDLVKVLLKNGADLHHTAEMSRYTALHFACFGPVCHVNNLKRRKTLQYHKTVSLLLEHGLSPNIRDKAGRTPLYIAARYSYHVPEIVEILLQHNANPNLRETKYGETPLQCQCRILASSHWFRHAESGARKERERDRCKLIQLLIANGAHIDTVNNFGESTLVTWKKVYKKPHLVDPDIIHAIDNSLASTDHLLLQCLAANSFLKFRTPFDVLPHHLKEFVLLHSRPTYTGTQKSSSYFQTYLERKNFLCSSDSEKSVDESE